MGFGKLTDRCALAKASELNPDCGLVRLILTIQSCVSFHAIWDTAWALLEGGAGGVCFLLYIFKKRTQF